MPVEGLEAARLMSSDTIVAIATAVGRGALAVVRLSGPRSYAIARRHVRKWPHDSRIATLSELHDNGTPIDEAVVTLFPGPNSYTGEDTVEFSIHGGQVVPNSLVAALIASGARQANAGEFTRRAVLNGKIDMLQAEAIGDLIDATSHAMQRTALNQLDGGLSRRLLALREALIELEALIAYDVDFPEEDDGPIPRERIEQASSRITASLKSLLATSSTGELVREGALVVIAGPPNVGKSSLFNALLGRSRAIVTDIPGTTRDALEAVVDGNPWPLRLVDTAGIRDATDQIERLGIEVSEKYLKDADVVLACADERDELPNVVRLLSTMTAASTLPVLTKIDLVSPPHQYDSNRLAVSAETGDGLQELLIAIERKLVESHGTADPDAPMLTRVRHQRALTAACEELERFQQVWLYSGLPVTVAGVHLRTAIFELEQLIGSVDVEDVLNRVFSSFCVGK